MMTREDVTIITLSFVVAIAIIENVVLTVTAFARRLRDRRKPLLPRWAYPRMWHCSCGKLNEYYTEQCPRCQTIQPKLP